MLHDGYAVSVVINDWSDEPPPDVFTDKVTTLPTLENVITGITVDDGGFTPVPL